MHMRALAAFGLAFVVFGCKSPNTSVAELKDVSVDDAAKQFVGEAVGRLAEARVGFFINRMPDDPDNPRVLKVKVDTAAKTVALDFTPYADILGDAATAARFTEIMTFPLPEDLANPAAFTLNDRDMAIAFGKSLSKLYAEAVEGSGGIDFEPNYFDDLYGQCEEQNFKKTAKVSMPNPAGGDTEIKFDCRKLKRQTGTKLTLTPLEGAMFLEYAGEFYKDANRVVRGRRFRFPITDAMQSPDRKTLAIEAFVSLVVVSGINKLDPGPEESYRGVGALRKVCAADAPDLTGAEPQTPKAAAQRFCQYFSTLTTFSECAFQSTSRLPNIALMFAGVLKNESGDDNIGDEGPEYGDAPLPLDGKVHVVLKIKGTRGQFIAPMSPMVHEMEVLYKPGTKYGIDSGSPGVALRPATLPPGRTFSGYGDFEFVPCANVAGLTAERAKRISHLRLSLTEMN